ncbi:MAG TPA: hypothetical protein DD724_03790, partial [Lactobacillus acetotolerans]|nr:hypothetical protein [Lactobacillus acetotolerans]
PMTTLKYYAHMFSDNDLVIASKMENSMSIQPAEKSEVEFNGNQYLGDGKIVGMPKQEKDSLSIDIKETSPILGE